MLVNGLPSDVVNIRDRGLLYGDGVFRTMRLQARKIVYWAEHFQKLQQDCAALNLACPQQSLLLDDIQQLTTTQTDGVLKLIVTRGIGQRGYAPNVATEATRIWDYAVLPDVPVLWYTQGISLQLCNVRLSNQPRLAGIKHLNRLENVLAAAELQAVEGLLQDEVGNVISGTRTNVFLYRDGVLLTPDLSNSGVAGVQRARVIAWAQRYHIPLQIRAIALSELLQADEAFVVNSVIGLWPVATFQQRSWSVFPMSQRIQQEIMS